MAQSGAGEPQLGISGFAAVPTALRATRVGSRDGDRSWLRYSDGKCGNVGSSGLTGTYEFKAWTDSASILAGRLDGYGSFAGMKEVRLRRDASISRRTDAFETHRPSPRYDADGKAPIGRRTR